MNYSRREFLKHTCAATLAGSLLSCQPTTHPPNIVLIMADDLGYGDLGCYGSDWIRTPHIDALAENGLKFTDYHSNGAVCTPTRAVLLTGRYQQRSGLEGVIYVRGETRQRGLSTDETTFAEVLKTAGYRTCIVGKWHLGYRTEFNPVHHGFDEFRGFVSGNIDYISHNDNAGIFDWWHNLEQVKEEGYSTDLITKHAVDFIRQNKDQPFCLYVAHESPHWPYQGRNDKADRFENTEFPARGTSPRPKEAFKEMIEVMDEGVGEIVTTLRELDLKDNTLVVFCSDNGGDPPYGDNGFLRGHKGQLWEGGHRVPGIAYWPNRIKPGVTNQPAMSMDWFPTMISLAASKNAVPLKLDGVDLSPVLFDNKRIENRKLFWRYRGQKAARQGDWKLLMQEDEEFLFNLADDPQEQNNLVETFPERVEELQRLYADWEADVLDGVELKTT